MVERCSVYRGRAVSWFRAGTGALLVASLLLACGEKKETIPFKKVKQMQEAGEFAQSLLPLSKVLDKQRGHPEANYLTGFAYYKLGKSKFAIEALQKSIKNPELLRDAGTLLVTIYLNNGNPKNALEISHRVLAEYPDEHQTLLQRARARAELGVELDAGLSDVALAMQDGSSEWRAVVTRGHLLLELDRVEEAVVALDSIEQAWLAGDKAASGKKLLVRWCRIGAQLAVSQAQEGPAKGLLGYCLREYGKERSVAKAALAYYRSAKDYEHLESALRSALENKPDHFEFQKELAEVMVLTGRDADATDLLVRIAERAVGDDQFQALWALVEHYESLEQYGEAVSSLEQAMRLQSDPRLAFRRVDLLVRDGQLESAMSSAMELEGQVFIDLGVGRVLLAQGKAREALERFDAGIEIWPENSGAHYFAGLAAEQLGDTERAIAEFREAVAVDPEAIDAASELARLLEQAEG